MIDTETIVLMDQKRIERSLKRIAQQIAERNREDKKLLFVGINTRGFAVASAIRTYLLPNYDDISCQQLNVGENSANDWDDGSKLGDSFMVLVDDVIFSGSTMFQALTQLDELIKLKEIHTAVLVDRGHRKLPVEAEFVGMELPTKLDEHVSVEVSGKGEIQKVILQKS